MKLSFKVTKEQERESSDGTMNRPKVCTTSVGGSIDLHWGNPSRDGQILKKGEQLNINFFLNESLIIVLDLSIILRCG